MPHRGIDRLAQSKLCRIERKYNRLIIRTVAFDAATFEIYGPLLNGGRLVITSKDTLLNLNC